MFTSAGQAWPVARQGPIAGTGCRLGQDVDPTSRLGSLDTSDRNSVFEIALVRDK